MRNHPYLGREKKKKKTRGKKRREGTIVGTQVSPSNISDLEKGESGGKKKRTKAPPSCKPWHLSTPSPLEEREKKKPSKRKTRKHVAGGLDTNMSHDGYTHRRNKGKWGGGKKGVFPEEKGGKRRRGRCTDPFLRVPKQPNPVRNNSF